MGFTERSMVPETRQQRKAAEPLPEQPPFPVHRLIAEAPALLGCSSACAAGALYYQESDNELSVSDAKFEVEKFLARPAGQEE